MQMIFNICFGVGVGYVVIAFFIGQIVDIGNFDGHIDFGTSVFPLKPSIIAAFLTVFGGVGSLMTIKEIPFLITFFVSGFLGSLVAFSIDRFILIPLYKHQNTSAVGKQSLIGMRAQVRVKIPQGKFGKITYFVNGNTYSSPAKSEDGNEIEKYEYVKIVCIENNIYYVKKENSGGQKT